MATSRTRVSRRGFLGRAAATTGLFAAPHMLTSAALGAEGKPPANDRICVGMIGMGGRGSGLGVGQIIGVCDTWRDRRERQAQARGATPYADFREMLARDEIDAVTIGTPDHWHVPIGVAAAKAGKDMYCSDCYWQERQVPGGTHPR